MSLISSHLADPTICVDALEYEKLKVPATDHRETVLIVYMLQQKKQSEDIVAKKIRDGARN